MKMDPVSSFAQEWISLLIQQIIILIFLMAIDLKWPEWLGKQYLLKALSYLYNAGLAVKLVVNLYRTKSILGGSVVGSIPWGGGLPLNMTPRDERA